MGCCCSSNRVEWNDSSQLYHYPVVSEERQPLSSRNGALVDTNLDTSIPDTYTHPPTPIPYDSNPQDSPAQTNDSENPIGEIIVAKDAKESVAIEDIDADLETSDELKKSTTPFVAPEECPTCLEEYDEENPKIMTKCEHHFHLSCILEWMERSDTCPVCDQEMEVNFPMDD